MALSVAPEAGAAQAVADLSSQADLLLRCDLRNDTTALAAAVTLGWQLKAATQAAWMVAPPQAEGAAAQLQQLAERSDSVPLKALAAWAGGIVGLARGELESALAQLDAAAAGWRQSNQGLHAAQVAVARLMPLTLLGRFTDAFDSGHAAEAELMRHGDTQGAAKVALNLGSLAMQRGRYAEAADHYRRASVRFARVNDREHSVMADVGLADARGLEGRLDEAARIYDRAEMRAQRHGLPVLAASAEHGRALLALGAGRHRAALSGLVRARSAYALIEVDHYLIEVERDLADAYLDLNLLPEALTIYGRLIDRLLSQGNAATLPWLQLQRARALARSGRPTAADQGLQAAAAAFAAQDHAAGLALSQLALLELRLSQATGEPDLDALGQQAATMAASMPLALLWRVRLAQACALRLQGRSLEVLQLLQPQVGPWEAVWVPQGRARRWDELGQAHLALGQTHAAADAFERSIEEFEQMQAALPGEEFKLAMLADHLHPYKSRLALALASEPPEEVLAWLDRYRARVLAERLGRGHEQAATSSTIDDDRRAQRARLNWIRRQAQRRAEDGDDDLPPALYEEATQLEQALLEQARRDRLAREEGTLPPSAEGYAQSLDLGALRRRFVGTRALIEYGLNGDELFAAVVAQGRVQVRRQLADWPQVRAHLHRLHYQLDTQRAGSARLHTHAEQLLLRCQTRLQALHQAVWAPLQALMPGVDEVVVVPCDLLQTLPFAALFDGCQWLDERLRITLAPNAALAPPVSVKRAPGRSVVVGEGARLRYMRLEVDAVTAELPEVMVLMDGMASVDAVMAAASDADVLHLACHGEFRGDNPRFSALHLGDGVLSAADIETQRLRAQLVVLSACETGRVPTSAGDEGLGLVRAFQLAGARDVVASLWAVDDEPTAHFMTAFYRHWAQGHGDVGQALQHARAAVRARWPHPFHWAAFNVYARALL